MVGSGTVDLKYAGFTVADALAGNVTDLRTAGFDAQDAMDANITNLKDAGFSVQEAWAAGVGNLAEAGYNMADIAGLTLSQAPTPAPTAATQVWPCKQLNKIYFFMPS